MKWPLRVVEKSDIPHYPWDFLAGFFREGTVVEFRGEHFRSIRSTTFHDPGWSHVYRSKD